MQDTDHHSFDADFVPTPPPPEHRKPWPVLDVWAATCSFYALVGRLETESSHISSRRKRKKSKKKKAIFISEGVSAEPHTETQKILDWRLLRLDLYFIKD